jgi:dienelactone hydrolase
MTMQAHKLRAGAVMVVLAACAGERAAPRPPAAPATLATPAAPDAPHFDILPGPDALSGDPLQITLAGLAPASEVELTAERPVSPAWPGAHRTLYRAQARFRVGADGRLDLGRDAPASGSYDGPDLRGLFWSMAPTEAPIADGWPDDRIQLVATQGGAVAAQAAITLRHADPRVELTQAGAELPGAVLARLPGPERRPAVIVLGGSEGGDWFARTMSPRLASHGYAVLGVPYYAPAYAAPKGDLQQLPPAFVDIPVDRLDRARDWLRRQPGVDGDRIAVYGVSKGAELALLAATRLPWVAAALAIVPSDVVWEGWGLPGQAPGTRSGFSWRGEPLPFVPYKDFDAELARVSTGGKVHIRRPQDAGRAAHPDAVARARIPVERYRGPVLVAGSGDDQVWASGEMAANVARSRATAGLATTLLVYPGAGHLLGGDGWSPTTQIDAAPFAVGGTPAATARAQAEVWRETLAFLARALPPRAYTGK